MIVEPPRELRALVARHFGLQFDDTKLPYLAEVLERRLRANRIDAATYLAMLARGARGELDVLAEELTIGETYFFRNAEQFRALVEHVLPERLAKAAPLRILSAGCASGEEPYSIAIATRGIAAHRGVSILAVDVNPAALDRAMRGRYTRWSLRETPPDIEAAWFHPLRDRHVQIDPEIRDAVRFEQKNLVVEDFALWAPSSYDVIFCRNVLMYFTRDVQRAIIERIERALVPGGYLFTGHAESLRGLSQLHLCHTQDTFYYQRRPEPARVEVVADVPLPPTPSATAPEPDVRDVRDLRIDEPRPDLPSVCELIDADRFDDALSALASLPADIARSADGLLVRAVALVHAGCFADAERTCEELTALDELHAGAHYVIALCREHAGDRAAAIEHARTAAYLDPMFAMPRLHLGLLARRAGDRDTARVELQQALALFAREDSARVRLFGGGFHREALVALCRAELAAIGGLA